MANRAVSLVSLKSESRSELTKSKTSFDDVVQNMEFEPFIKISCKLFECPITVNVTKKILISTKHIHKSKYNRRRSIRPPADLPSSDSSLGFHREPDHHKLLLTAVYDDSTELAEIFMSKYSYAPIPRVLMQVIALKVKFTRHLTKFTIRQCCIDMYTIYELNKILTMSNITDVCLDHSPLKEANYDILLSDPSSLRNLSLSRCNINDIVCERIASRLRYLEPAEETLLILNLSSNYITDVGLKHLGEALRSNRHLRYLNISDNHIGDAGAKYIFEVLAEFPLNNDEIEDMKRCFMHYLKSKESLYRKYMLNMGIDKKPVKKGKLGKVKSMTKRHKDTDNVSDEFLRMKARSMALETLGPFEHPFCPSMVIVKEGRSYCIGNFTLCYLNLRYNNLTYESVQRLAAVVSHQKLYRSEHLCGLLNVLVEGNYLPEKAEEYLNIKKDMNGTASKLSIIQVDKMAPGSRYMAQRNI